MNNNNYIVIQWWMINELKIKGNELLLYGLIYWYSQDWESKFRGSLTYIQKALWISRHTVIDLLKKLIKKELIIKNEPWIYSVKTELLKNIYSVKTGTPLVQKVNSDSVENAHNIYINKNKSKYVAETIYKNYFTKIPENKKQYVKKSQTILYINQLLKEYTEDDLNSSIKNYFNNTDSLYIKAPQYFFSNTKQWKDYRLFEQWIEKNNDIIKKREFNIENIKF